MGTIFSTQLNAQFWQKDTITYKHLTRKEGLTATDVYQGYKDSQGYLWFITDHGLTRYDGIDFKKFLHDPLDEYSLPDNNVMAIVEDQHSDLWIANLKGVCFYERKTGRFIKVEIPGFDPGINNLIPSMTVDTSGNIWLATQNSGIFRISRREDGTLSSEQFLGDKGINYVYASARDTLWYADYEGYTYMCPLRTGDKPGREPLFQAGKTLTWFYYEYGPYIFSSHPDGLYAYHKQKGTVDEILFGAEQKRLMVGKIVKEKGSTAWVATNMGIWLVDLESGETMNHLPKESEDTYGVIDDFVTNLIRYDEETLVASTPKGVTLIDFNKNVFSILRQDKKSLSSLYGNHIKDVIQYNEEMWLALNDGGINYINKEESFYFPPSLLTNDDSNVKNGVQALTLDTLQNRLWYATRSGLGFADLIEFDPGNPEFYYFELDGDADFVERNELINEIKIDAFGILWGVSRGAGLFSVKKDGDEPLFMRTYSQLIPKNTTRSNGYLFTLEIQNDSILWAGALDGMRRIGFKGQELKESVFEHFGRWVNTSEVSGDLIEIGDILIDSKNRVWVGMNNGLGLYEEKTNTFRAWSSFAHVYSPRVKNLLEDQNGNLWLTTSQGLFEFDPETETFTIHAPGGKTPITKYEFHSGFVNPNGTVLLGTYDGLLYFTPSDTYGEADLGNIFVSNLRLRDSLVTYMNGVGIEYLGYRENDPEIKLSEGDLPVVMEFNRIAIASDRKDSFIHRLLPNTSSWNKLTGNEIQLIDLEPGSYTLEVSTMSTRGQVSGTPLVLHLNMAAVWYKTTLAYVVYCALLLLLITGFYRIRLNRKIARAERQKLLEINEMKDDFFANITHDFRTPLTVIMGMTETLKGKLTLSSEKSFLKGLDMIERNGSMLLKMVNDILDLSKDNRGVMTGEMVHQDIVFFVRYLCEGFQSLARVKNVDLILKTSHQEIWMDMDPSKTAAILRNLISNALKFTPAGGSITVQLDKTDRDLEIRVIDTGVGMEKDLLEKIFDRYFTTAPATHVGSKAHSGIGLAMVRQYVRLLSGEVSVRSNPGKGSEFSVCLPLLTNADKVSKKEVLQRAFGIEHTAGYKDHYPGTDQPREKSEGNLRVLVIEDNKDVCHYIETILDSRYDLFFEHHGTAGVQTALEEIPDIILSDVSMPGLDGFQLCEQLRNDRRTDHIPIILLTARAADKDRLTGLQAGADAYLTKPFIPEELLLRINKLLEQRERLREKFAVPGLKFEGRAPEERFINQVVEYVEEDLSDTGFGPDALAEKMNLSTSQLYRKIKNLTGRSTALYIRAIRLQHARTLLNKTDLTVAEVGYHCGFSDASWFSKCFKKEFGVSPSELTNLGETL
ncbi:hybrid sensor histidine kinase/response regulator [Robertkochia marina]|uniref:histidine kinase n=1 Tax=Robertkochia marina TaxID=1227945 RepID=A0A4V3UYI7_9FLAO|nr:ATP-binding protein [Robertkochia marina]THD69848.1 hybrid sensor histidine kinase/response regulator [Robertkochia marina]TRZ46807.1 response regulator [Robertkochia marina]